LLRPYIPSLDVQTIVHSLRPSQSLWGSTLRVALTNSEHDVSFLITAHFSAHHQLSTQSHESQQSHDSHHLSRRLCKRKGPRTVSTIADKIVSQILQGMDYPTDALPCRRREAVGVCSRRSMCEKLMRQRLTGQYCFEVAIGFRTLVMENTAATVCYCSHILLCTVHIEDLSKIFAGQVE